LNFQSIIVRSLAAPVRRFALLLAVQNGPLLINKVPGTVNYASRGFERNCGNSFRELYSVSGVSRLIYEQSIVTCGRWYLLSLTLVQHHLLANPRRGSPLNAWDLLWECKKKTRKLGKARCVTQNNVIVVGKAVGNSQKEGKHKTIRSRMKKNRSPISLIQSMGTIIAVMLYAYGKL
jgi:hypothetical protein